MPDRFMKNVKKLIFIAILLVLALVLYFPKTASAATDTFPKLANYYFLWNINDEAQITELAKWDVVTLSPPALEYSPNIIKKLKEKNPKITILAYVAIQEIPYDQKLLSTTSNWKAIYDAVDKNNWWLKDASGQHITLWPGAWYINASSLAPKDATGKNWLDYVPQYVNDTLYKKYGFDGVFFDNTWDNISFISSTIDINGDGVADSKQAVDQAWKDGLSQIINKTRQLSPNKIITANGNSNYFNNLLNGRLQEQFPIYYEGGWVNSEKMYLQPNLGYSPQFPTINVNTNNTGVQNDYQKVRFGMASALLGDGYYSFDYGDMGHDKLWWYDEYNYYLGQAKSSPKNLLNSSNSNLTAGVWQRDFQNAVVLINSTNAEQKINFEVEYEKIKGTQDQETNNGAVIKNATLPANDGLILLRRIEEIKNSPYFNGSFIRVFNSTGDLQRNGFFLYENQFRGNNVITKKDINKDNKLEIIVGDESKITIYDLDKNVLTSFYPYGTKYNKGLNYDLSDIDNDGNFEIITGTANGAAPLVKIFNNKGKEINAGFYAYAKTFKGGVNVAVCDFKGNGVKSIVTGAGFMGGSSVKIFSTSGKLQGAAYAYAKTFKGGVYVACGDVNGDKKDEIVTGAGFSGSPQVRVFNSKFAVIGKSFWPFDKTNKNGVRVVANDIDGNGVAEILTASPTTFTTALIK
jgi:hypothetical protein